MACSWVRSCIKPECHTHFCCWWICHWVNFLDIEKYSLPVLILSGKLLVRLVMRLLKVVIPDDIKPKPNIFAQDSLRRIPPPPPPTHTHRGTVVSESPTHRPSLRYQGESGLLLGSLLLRCHLSEASASHVGSLSLSIFCKAFSMEDSRRYLLSVFPVWIFKAFLVCVQSARANTG